MSNQSLRQASVRAVTSTTGTYEEDFLALFDNDGIAAGTFNERFYLWLAGKTSLTGRTLDELMNAFAVSQGVSDWNSLGTFDASDGGGGDALLLEIGDALLLETGDQLLLEA